MKRKTAALAIMMSVAVLGTMLGSEEVSAKKKTTPLYLLTERQEYQVNQEGNLYKCFEYKNSYNKKGIQIAYEGRNFGEDGKESSSSKWVTTYDKKGRIKLEKGYQDGKCDQIQKYTYKKNKQIVKTFDEKKKLIEKSVTTMSDRKHVTVYYNSKGKKLSTVITSFDKKGNILKTVTKKQKKVLDETIYTYKKNSLTKQVLKSYTEEGTITNLMETVYKKGKMVSNKSVMYEDGDFNSSWTYTYSYKGKYIYATLIEASVYSDEVTKTLEKLRYDKAGNSIYSWKKVYEDDKLVKTYDYKNEFFTSGGAKGCLKKTTCSSGGDVVSQEIYKVKKIKVKK